MKIAGSHVISVSDSSESSSSSSSSEDDEVVPQHKSNSHRSSPSTPEDSDDDISPPLLLLPPPQPQRPRPRPRLMTKPPISDDPHIISYAASLPPPPQPRQTTSVDDSRFISYATSLPPPPRPQLASTQNLEFETEINLPITNPARPEMISPTLDSEPLSQAQNTDIRPDSPLSELEDTQYTTPLPPLAASGPAQSKNPKAGKKMKSQKQDVPGPARRSGRSKAAAGLNAVEQDGNEKGKGRNRH